MHAPPARSATADRLRRPLCALLFAFAACGTVAAPMSRAYVWQRIWGGDLRDSLRAHHGAFSFLDILAGELSWKGGDLAEARVSPDWRLASELGMPLGLVLRIGPCPSRWAPDSPETLRVMGALARRLAEAEAAGAHVAELQCDFDSGVSQLADYTRLLHALRLAFPGRRLTATALPAWLKSPDFPKLLAELDSYVLQVHSLEKPASPTDSYSLCPTQRAREWITAASSLGRPFRVALPTYGYLLGFSADGHFLRLQAEGTRRPDPAIAQWIPVMSDPLEIAGLVRELQDTPPAHLEALCWFRLPAGREERNWPWATLREVMHGRPPAPRLELSSDRQDDGSFLVRLSNHGTWKGPMAKIHVEVAPHQLLASDALDGWRVVRRDAQGLTLAPSNTHAELAPNEERTVAWLRLPPGASPRLRLE